VAVSDPVTARRQFCSVRFYVTIAKAAAILNKTSYVNQILMESMTLMQMKAKTNSVPIH